MTRGFHKKPRRPRHRQSLEAGPTEMTELTVTVPRDRVGALKRYANRLRRSNPARREEVLWRLKRHLHELERFGIASLALFGSTVRNTARRESDVDLLVEFQDGRPDGMLEFVELKHVLESIVGRPVDLVTPANLKPRIKGRILAEAVRVV
ncbi:MAG: nucleotidyltransferase family protein [Caenispirillum bisanense]|nr:nucleotidyltransferase family protein [Caenispirillum bisanense]MCA1974004.1 nucleotidyltransferase family protein [Caenispirillum sp.]